MNAKDFLRLGVPLGEARRRATDFISRFILGGGDKSRLHEEVKAIVADPSAFVDDPLRGEFAKALISARRPSSGLRPPSPAPASEGHEERENYFVGRLPRVAPKVFGATAGLIAFAPSGQVSLASRELVQFVSTSLAFSVQPVFAGARDNALPER